ncbi:MAG: DUF3995 domain-containing protein [Cytophagales bacterium]|nr:DUF3995 domain-containing protein [Cytophagales bacterium]
MKQFFFYAFARLFNGISMCLIGLLHFYWAGGGKWAISAALPTNSLGDKQLAPTPFVTFIAGLIFLSIGLSFLFFSKNEKRKRTLFFNRKNLFLIFSLGFLLRAIGDFHFSGFFKTTTGTLFAHWDTLLFSPLCLLLSVNSFIIYFILKKSIKQTS